MIDTFAASATVQAIASGIVTSLWLGALIGVSAGFTLHVLRGASANARHLVACIGLFLMAMMPVLLAAAHIRELRLSDAEWHRLEASAPAVAAVTPASSINGPGLTLRPEVSNETGGSQSGDTEIVPRWPAVVVFLWVAGVLILSLRLVGGWLMVARIKRIAVHPPPEFWRTRAQILADRLRSKVRVRILESTLVDSPVVVGSLRPMILLPVCALSGLSPAQLDAILAHELAHITRHDYVVNMLQVCTETLLFYHPAVWWLSRQIRVEREHCCDDAAVALCDDRTEYATALANLEALRIVGPRFGLAAAAGRLERRIRRVLRIPAAPRNGSTSWMAALVLASAIALVFQDAEVRAAVMQLAAGQETTLGGVRGQVVDAQSGKPIAGASISLAQRGDVHAVKAGNDGRYELRAVKPGEYQLSARAAGVCRGAVRATRPRGRWSRDRRAVRAGDARRRFASPGRGRRCRRDRR